MTIRIRKILLYLILWGFVATILLISNSISLALTGGTGYIPGTALYHFVASTIWIPTSILLTRFYRRPGRSTYPWLFYSFGFYPVFVVADTLFRSLLRYLILEYPVTLENILIVLLTLVDANFLIFGCLTFFIFSSMHMLSDQNRALQYARERMDLNVGELDRISSVLPPGFLGRNLDRILQTYEKSFEKGEAMIVTFSDFLRLVTYRGGAQVYSLAAAEYREELIETYETYLSCYCEQEIRLAVSEIEDIYLIDETISISKDEAASTST